MIKVKSGQAVIAMAATVAASLMWGSLAAAQIADGHANDASNQIGTSGYNGNSQRVPYGTNSNQIVYGNVTAGKEFHGTASRDPRAFRGNVPTQVTDFTRVSSGAPVAHDRELNPNVAEPFYSTSRWVPPPQGFVAAPNNAGYVAAQPTQGLQPTQVNNQLENPNLYGPRADVLLLPGPLDSNQQQTILSLSPLYGVRQWNPNDLGDRRYLEQWTNLRPGNAIDRQNIDPASIQTTRNELLIRPDGQNSDPNAAPDPNAPHDPNAPLNDVNVARPLSDSVIGKPLPGEQKNQPLAGSLRTGESSGQMMLLPATKQSAIYQKLYERLEKRYGPELAHTQVYAKELADQRAAEKVAADKTLADKKGHGFVGVPLPFVQVPLVPTTTQPSTLPTRLLVGTGGNSKVPVRVDKLSEGIHAHGLSEMMKKAEDSMKAGKYAAAVDQYDAAQQAVPNNPLIWLGRANAELAGSFYGLAEKHLREAFSTDHALLMGQFNLRAMIGDDRLQFLVTDLRELAEKDQASSTPVFLLAYIAYNTGNEPKALGYLDLAQKRSSRKDDFYKIVREAWASTDTDGNPADHKNK